MLGGNSLESPFAMFPFFPVLRQKQHAGGVFARLGQYYVQSFTFPRKKIVRQLSQDSRAVARRFFRPARSAMMHTNETFNSDFKNFVGFSTIKVSHKPDAAGVMLKI